MTDLEVLTRHIANQREFETSIVSEIIELRAQISDGRVTDELLLELIAQASQSERRLIELNALKDRFLGMAAHDLRSPLSTIQGMSEILKQDAALDDATRAEFHATIHSISGHLLELIDDLLDVSAIARGRLVLDLEAVNLGELVRKALRLNAFKAESKGITIEVESVPAVSFEGDEGRLVEVLDNIISNAIKFSESGTCTTVMAEADDEAVIIKVRDEGPGIPEAEQPEVFGGFSRLSNRPTGGERSSGLGLSIAKSIVDAHGGRIDVDSAPGRGSTFSVHLPRRAP